MTAHDSSPDAALHGLPGQTVGATLRAARQRHGAELREVAAILRIRAPFLQAIEDGQFEALPGIPYAIGFVRTYADHLGLDGAEMVRRFKSEAAGLERRTSLSFPSPAPEGRVPGTAALLISVVAAAVVFGGWYFYQNGSIERLTQRVPEVPDRLAGPAPVAPGDLPPGSFPTPGSAPALAAPPPAPPPARSGAAPTPGVANDAPLPPPPGDPTRRPGSQTGSPTAAQTAALPPAVPPTAPSAAAQAEIEDGPPPPPTEIGAPGPAGSGIGTRPATAPAGTAAVAPPPGAAPAAPGAAAGPAPGAGAPAIPAVPQVAAVPPETRVFGAQNGDSRVVIKSSGESWVQIRDASNTPVLTRVLRPGDVYRVPNQPGLTMMTGNAGALEVLVDGAAIPSLGGVGIVRRNIALDAERLKAGGN